MTPKAGIFAAMSGIIRYASLTVVAETCVNGLSAGFADESLNGEACFTATGMADVPIQNPYFNAVAQGVNQASPAVELLGRGLQLGAEFGTGVPLGLLVDLASQSQNGAQDNQAAAAGVVMRNPADIRFTQDTVTARFPMASLSVIQLIY
jgi:hypothetical protein